MSSMSKLLIESTAVPQATGKDGRWRAVLITPGQGSSGFYSEAMLKESGPIALRKGAKSFVTHNRLENGEPDPFQMWGFLAEDAVYEDGVGLVGEIEVLPSWRDRVAEVAPHTALSVYVMGEADSDGNVTALFEAADNGVDMVVHAGRPGSGLVEKLYESLNSEKPAVALTGAQEKETQAMEISEVAAKVDSLIQKFEAFVTKSEAHAVEADAEKVTVEEALTAYRTAAASVDAADVLPSQREALLAEAAKGVDIAPRIVEAQKIRDEAKSFVESAPQGRVLGGEAYDFGVERWSN